MHATAECFDHIHEDLVAKIADSHVSRNSFGDISLDLPTRTLFGSSSKIILPCFEFQIFWLLMRSQGGIITRDEFVYFLYEESDDDIPLCNTVEVFVVRLRKKLPAVTNRVFIHTFRGIGYQLLNVDS